MTTLTLSTLIGTVAFILATISETESKSTGHKGKPIGEKMQRRPISKRGVQKNECPNSNYVLTQCYVRAQANMLVQVELASGAILTIYPNVNGRADYPAIILTTGVLAVQDPGLYTRNITFSCMSAAASPDGEIKFRISEDDFFPEGGLCRVVPVAVTLPVEDTLQVEGSVTSSNYWERTMTRRPQLSGTSSRLVTPSSGTDALTSAAQTSFLSVPRKNGITLKLGVCLAAILVALAGVSVVTVYVTKRVCCGAISTKSGQSPEPPSHATNCRRLSLLSQRHTSTANSTMVTNLSADSPL